MRDRDRRIKIERDREKRREREIESESIYPASFLVVELLRGEFVELFGCGGNENDFFLFG